MHVRDNELELNHDDHWHFSFIQDSHLFVKYTAILERTSCSSTLTRTRGLSYFQHTCSRILLLLACQWWHGKDLDLNSTTCALYSRSLAIFFPPSLARKFAEGRYKLSVEAFP